MTDWHPQQKRPVTSQWPGVFIMLFQDPAGQLFRLLSSQMLAMFSAW